MNIEDWKSQLKRGTLEYAILLLIRSKPYYGYEIISEIEKWDIIAAKESTVYPLLRRLLKESYLESFWEDSKEGLPPRKYYKLTQLGRDYLQCMNKEWGNLLHAISQLSQREEEGYHG